MLKRKNVAVGQGVLSLSLLLRTCYSTKGNYMGELLSVNGNKKKKPCRGQRHDSGNITLLVLNLFCRFQHPMHFFCMSRDINRITILGVKLRRRKQPALKLRVHCLNRHIRKARQSAKMRLRHTNMPPNAKYVVLRRYSVAQRQHQEGKDVTHGRGFLSLA